MTKPVRFRESDLRRALKVATDCPAVRRVSISPDGKIDLVLVDESGNVQVSDPLDEWLANNDPKAL